MVYITHRDERIKGAMLLFFYVCFLCRSAKYVYLSFWTWARAEAADMSQGDEWKRSRARSTWKSSWESYRRRQPKGTRPLRSTGWRSICEARLSPYTSTWYNDTVPGSRVPPRTCFSVSRPGRTLWLLTSITSLVFILIHEYSFSVYVLVLLFFFYKLFFFSISWDIHWDYYYAIIIIPKLNSSLTVYSV